MADSGVGYGWRIFCYSFTKKFPKGEFSAYTNIGTPSLSLGTQRTRMPYPAATKATAGRPDFKRANPAKGRIGTGQGTSLWSFRYTRARLTRSQSGTVTTWLFGCGTGFGFACALAGGEGCWTSSAIRLCSIPNKPSA